jgi:hypothetical protein
MGNLETVPATTPAGNSRTGRGKRWKHTALQLGVVVLMALNVVCLLAPAVERVRDAADRTT